MRVQVPLGPHMLEYHNGNEVDLSTAVQVRFLSLTPEFVGDSYEEAKTYNPSFSSLSEGMTCG